jgi:NAD(P)H-hydrate epimerase
MKFVSKILIKKIYEKREKWVHKGDFGNLLIIGGSKKYSGSPALEALSAIRTGVDITTIISPERSANIIATFSPDLITYPLKGDYLNKKYVNEIFGLMKGMDTLVIGGGLETKNETLQAVRLILMKVKIPCVIDASAIHALSINKKLGKNFVITPHSREFYAFTKIKLNNNVNDRARIVKKIAEKMNCTILLKGAVDIISNGKKVALNNTGCCYLTKGGTGDTLAGILGALLAQGADIFDAACTSAYINGRAGELASKKYKEGLMAEDLIKEIPNVIK